jgi:apolipoprotein N-acyltransferase
MFLLSFAFGGLYSLGLNESSFLVLLSLLYFFFIGKFISTWSTLGVGLLFGLGICFFHASWLYEASEHFGVDHVTRVLFVFLIYFGISLSYAIVPWLMKVILSMKISKAFLVLTMANIWYLSEWSRTWLYTGFPYFESSLAFVDTILAGYFPIIGSLGVTWVIAICIISFGFILTEGKKLKTLLILGLFSVFLGGWGLGKVSFTYPVNEVSVRAINGKLDKKGKQKAQLVDTSIRNYLKLSKEMPLPELVIWPESAIPDKFFRRLEQGLGYEFQQLSQAGVQVIVGTFLTELEDEVKLYNTMLVGDNHNMRYYKQHAVPFGEYMPMLFEPFFPSGFLEDIDEGEEGQELIVLGESIIKPIICFESLFASLSRVPERGNLIVNISDHSWFESDNVSIYTIKALRARALENHKPVVRSDNMGVSVIIGYDGSILAVSEIISSYVDNNLILRGGLTPYAIYGNFPLLVVTLTLSILIIFYPFLMGWVGR